MTASRRATRIRFGNPSAGVMSQDPFVARRKFERSPVIDRLEQIITQDIGGRGLAVDPRDNLVIRCRGNLEHAARSLASDGASIAIVTGFYVAHAQAPTVETDGPCGTIALAWILAEIGYRVTVVTDSIGAAIVRAGLHAAPRNASSISLEVFPFDGDIDASAGRNMSSDGSRACSPIPAYVNSFFHRGPGESLTHLIAVERAGPSWSPALGWTTAERSRFTELCPAEHQNQVHNFRGQIITGQTARTHLLFEFIPDNHLHIRTIGIGDGGNEIGMGSIPWEVIHANIPSGLGARIACRIASDWTIACGVSNWGAYALASAVASLRGFRDVLEEWTDARERAVLAALVQAGAVDGVTGTPLLSVDGLPIEQHLAIWRQIRQACEGK